MDEIKEYVRNSPYVGDDGIYFPVNDYTEKGIESLYKLVIPKQLFVEAYNKWIKEN